jgi:heterodisulfide reductase subunit A
MSRIGVFVCWCGENIARTVDVQKVVDAVAELPGALRAALQVHVLGPGPGHDPREDRRRKAGWRGGGLLLAAHAPEDLPRAAATAGLNPYLLEMANIREQCSWVHHDRDLATAKAIEPDRHGGGQGAARPALEPIRVPVTRRALVIGGGVAGIQAALDIADAGYEVVLVEREPSIGGKMAGLSETFPTLDCSQCILTPRMVEWGSIRASSSTPTRKWRRWRVHRQLQGHHRQKARYVDMSKCTGCGECSKVCPLKRNPSEFDYGMGMRPAIYMPFPQAVPARPVIDKKTCAKIIRNGCGLCEKKCAPGAINFEDRTAGGGAGGRHRGGHRLQALQHRPRAERTRSGYGEYGYGKYKDVIDSLQFERLVSASGPPTASPPALGRQDSARRWSSFPAWARATTPRACPTARRSAACTPPSTPCCTSTRCMTARRTFSTWTSAPAARGTTSSCAAPSSRTARNTTAGASRRSPRRTAS